MKQTIEEASKEYGKKIILGSQGFEEVDFKRGAEWRLNITTWLSVKQLKEVIKTG